MYCQKPQNGAFLTFNAVNQVNTHLQRNQPLNLSFWGDCAYRSIYHRRCLHFRHVTRYPTLSLYYKRYGMSEALKLPILGIIALQSIKYLFDTMSP